VRSIIVNFLNVWRFVPDVEIRTITFPPDDVFLNASTHHRTYYWSETESVWWCVQESILLHKTAREIIVCLDLQVRKQGGVLRITLIIRNFFLNWNYAPHFWRISFFPYLFWRVGPHYIWLFWYVLYFAYFAFFSISLIQQNLWRSREPCPSNCGPWRYNQRQSLEAHQCICTYFISEEFVEFIAYCALCALYNWTFNIGVPADLEMNTLMF